MSHPKTRASRALGTQDTPDASATPASNPLMPLTPEPCGAEPIAVCCAVLCTGLKAPSQSTIDVPQNKEIEWQEIERQEIERQEIERQEIERQEIVKQEILLGIQGLESLPSTLDTSHFSRIEDMPDFDLESFIRTALSEPSTAAITSPFTGEPVRSVDARTTYSTFLAPPPATSEVAPCELVTSVNATYTTSDPAGDSISDRVKASSRATKNRSLSAPPKRTPVPRKPRTTSTQNTKKLLDTKNQPPVVKTTPIKGPFSFTLQPAQPGDSVNDYPTPSSPPETTPAQVWRLPTRGCKRGRPPKAKAEPKPQAQAEPAAKDEHASPHSPLPKRTCRKKQLFEAIKQIGDQDDKDKADPDFPPQRQLRSRSVSLQKKGPQLL
ncbi:hypothetical protein BG004_005968 [Podila humilis]|nr:hypothetical protein BG004_005968 [Podila humilis]